MANTFTQLKQAVTAAEKAGRKVLTAAEKAGRKVQSAEIKIVLNFIDENRDNEEVSEPRPLDTWRANRGAN